MLNNGGNPNETPLEFLARHGALKVDDPDYPIIFFQPLELVEATDFAVASFNPKDGSWGLVGSIMFALDIYYPNWVFNLAKNERPALVGISRMGNLVVERGYPVKLTAQVITLLIGSNRLPESQNLFNHLINRATMEELLNRCMSLAAADFLTGEQKLTLAGTDVKMSELEAQIKNGVPANLALEFYEAIGWVTKLS